jgi:drug/metabolite transporter (DMT)-like permease
LGFGSLYTKEKQLLSILFSLGLQMLISSLILLPLLVQLELVNLMSIPAISWWSIAYLVIIGSILSFMPTCCKSSGKINSIYAYINQLWQFC